MEQLELMILEICDMPMTDIISMTIQVFGISVATFSLIYFALWGINQSVKFFKNITR